MSSRRLRIGVAVGALLLAAVAGGRFLSSSRPAAAALLEPDTPEVVDLGKTLYAQHCAACHGAALEGQPDWRKPGPDGRLPAPPHDATGHTWHHPDAVLVQLTKAGPTALAGPGYASNMPGFAGALSDAEIVAVLSYIKSTWPPEIRAHHDAINARAATR